MTKHKDDLSSFVFGRVQPQALDLEEAVIGAIILEKDAFRRVFQILEPRDFYRSDHEMIYRAFINLYRKAMPIDMLTVVEELKLMGKLTQAGGPARIAELSNKVASTANLEKHAIYVKGKSFERDAITVGSQVIETAYDETTDPDELKQYIERVLSKLVSKMRGRTVKTLDDALIAQFAVYDDIRARKDKGKDAANGVLGVPTGLDEWDDKTSGLQKEDLIVIGAEPGMGKTSLLLTTIRHSCIHGGVPMAIFSLEMSAGQLVDRTLSAESNVDSQVVRNPLKQSDDERLAIYAARDRIAGSPLYIDDNPGATADEIKSKSRRFVEEYGVQVIMIDYLQIMGWGHIKDERQALEYITRELKGLAKELQITVILLSQLKDNPSEKKGTPPTMKRLKGSRAIEADADVVILIHRPEYYDILEGPNKEDFRGIAGLIFDKNRHGSKGTVKVRFEGKFCRFRNLNDTDDPFEQDNSHLPDDIPY